MSAPSTPSTALPGEIGARHKWNMDPDPLRNPEVEIVCPHCGYRTTRTPDRLRRATQLVCPECGEEILPGGDDDARQS